MIDKDAVTSTLDAITQAINTHLNAIDGDDRGTVLANLTISLFRACEEELTDESFDELVAHLDEDDGEEEFLH